MISLALRVITKYRYVSRLKHAAVTDIDDIDIADILGTQIDIVIIVSMSAKAISTHPYHIL